MNQMNQDLLGDRIFDTQAFEAGLKEFFFAKLKDFDFQYNDVSLKVSTSKWKVSSALQKCIRRGIPAQAGRYAQALVHGKEGEYFWNRLPTIALEDIGPANPELCAFVLMCARFKTIRSQVQEDKLADFLCHELAKSFKSRAYCDLMCAWHFDPEHKVPAPLEFMKLKALCHSHAKVLGVTEPVDPLKDVPMYLANLKNTNLSDPLWYTVICATKKSVYGLHSSILPLWMEEECTSFSVVEECKPELGELVGGVPLWAFDQHVLEGKRALSYLVKSLELETKMPYMANTKALGMTLFQVESALLDRRISNPKLDMIKAENDRCELVGVGIPSSHQQICKDFILSEPVQLEITRVRKRIVLGK